MFVCQTPHFFAESVGGVGFNEPEVLVFCTCIGSFHFHAGYCPAVTDRVNRGCSGLRSLRVWMLAFAEWFFVGRSWL